MQYEGAVNHVAARGVERRAIFDGDRELADKIAELDAAFLVKAREVSSKNLILKG